MNLYVLHHLGMGDHIVMNAIYRNLAATYDLVVLPVKYHNVASMQYMLRDLPNVLIRPVEDDAEMVMFRDHVWKDAKHGVGAFKRFT
jgi:hypothetical protein